MLKELDTPALVLNLDVMEKNLRRMSMLAKESGIKLRPHIKTHKSPYIALKQIEYGAAGITVAKLGEAEVMSRHGIKEILVAYPIIGEKKLERLKVLAKEVNIITSLDSVEVGEGINRVGAELGKEMQVYVEVNTGLNRVGKDQENTVELIERLAGFEYVTIKGLMTHAGQSYKTKNKEQLQEISVQEGEYLVATQRLVKEKLGIDIPEISVGSTPTSYIGHQVAGVTEMRPGTYVFNDGTLIELGLIDEKDCALTIVSTVVSKPDRNRVIVDAGSKTLSSDKGGFNQGFGLVKNKDVYVSWLSEEHGVIESMDVGANIQIGEVVEIIPNHVCPTVNLANELIGYRKGKIERFIQVEARGKNK
ncbi:alanine racemase [Bacillus sp. JJ1562]|uniref:alanine racemase n=1 Tax=Bacillus sp. JJ1562 TaxID=3122960 RepID=UPI0030032E51